MQIIRAIISCIFICVLFFCTDTIAEDVVEYGYGSWNADDLGNHRAVVMVEKEAEAVALHIPWRRRDIHAKDGAIAIVSARTGEQIKNIFKVIGTREYVDLIFQPAAGPGRYYIYYLINKMHGSRNYPTVSYPKWKCSADKSWLQENVYDGNDNPLSIASFERAKCERIESIDALNSFYPMEVIATSREKAELLSENPDAEFLLFPEYRNYPIKMTKDLPYRWVNSGPLKSLRETVKRGEYYSFQIGLYAARNVIKSVAVGYSDFISENSDVVIPAGEFTCFNLEGVDWTGQHFQKSISVKEGEVQALWFGVQIPKNCVAGEYASEITVLPEGMPSSTVSLRLNVSTEESVAHGDDQPENHSRLRWLNSRIALDDGLVPPFTAVKVDGKTVSCLGREVKLDALGLPEQITSYFAPEMTYIAVEGRELLDTGMELIVELPNKETLTWQPGEVRFTKTTEGIAIWNVDAKAGPLKLDLQGSLEFDGAMEYRLSIEALEDFKVLDIRLELPLRQDIAKYMMGLGYKGGTRPDHFQWKWDPRYNQDSVWIGDVNAGIQASFRDANYVRPLNTNFYHAKPLNMPPSWWNDGRGGIELNHDSRNSRYSLVSFSGARSIRAGEKLNYHFRLLLTPFKPIDVKGQWHHRFFHAYKTIEEVQQAGANTINIHHANDINPYINYPFLRSEQMKAYIDRAHDIDFKVKIYYTVRELSNRAPEIFALRSLGFEIFSDGPGGGFSWLQEHLQENYIAAWFVPKLKDAAVVNSGVSRWHNYYLEGLNWLVKNVDIDGLYIDDVAFDKTVMKRVRKILDRGSEGALIDLHSANQFNYRDGYANSANLYMEHFPYLNRLWFGEYFDYDSQPDFWLVEVSGIPFGLMGEMLQGGGNPWRGMVFGMTARSPWGGDNEALWKAWDDFGIKQSEMIGYWVTDNPVKTSHEKVLATSYVKNDKVMVALASWAKGDQNIRLNIDWSALGFGPNDVSIFAPEIRNFQEERSFSPSDPIPVEKGKGWLLIISQP